MDPVLPSAPLDVPAWPVVDALPHWQVVDFISDLHLHAHDADTVAAWQDYLDRTPAQAVFMLGDLFDAWIGDDVIEDATPHPGTTVYDGFERRCAQSLRETSGRVRLFFMRGNRDFLIGEHFAKTCQLTLLPDPSVLEFGGARWLLTHGDALCLDDTDYQAFRARIREATWQRAFLAQPMERRRRIATELRAQSEQHQRGATRFVDADPAACVDWLQRAGAGTLVHGHTHRPADHDLPGGLRRIVLSDWDLQARPQRAEVLRITLPAHDRPPVVQRLSLAQACAGSSS